MQTSYARVSHDLKPFLDYFDSLCNNEKQLATKITTPTKGSWKGGGTEYKLVGFLHEHIDNLKKHQQQQQQRDKESKKKIIIGDHLIKCSSSDLAASHRAKERYLQQEELQNQGKRRKLNTGNGKATKCLLESILEICYHYNLQEHLDIVDIAWMRTSCKLFGKYAAKMATARMQDIRFSYSIHIADENAPESDNEDEEIFVNAPSFAEALEIIQAREAAAARAAQAHQAGAGLVPDDVDAPTGDAAADSPDDIVVHRDEITIKYGMHLYPRHFVRKALHAPLVLRSLSKSENDTTSTTAVAADAAASEGRYVPDNDEKQFLVEWPGEGGEADDNPCRLLVRIFIDGVKKATNGHIKEYPERDLLFTTPPLEVQRYTFYGFENYWGMPAPTPLKFAIDESREPARFVFHDVTFTFRELLGIYARKKFRLEKQRMDEMKTKGGTGAGGGRVTLTYKNYVRALAAEARLAPGNERDFNVMEGW